MPCNALPIARHDGPVAESEYSAAILSPLDCHLIENDLCTIPQSPLASPQTSVPLLPNEMPPADDAERPNNNPDIYITSTHDTLSADGKQGVVSLRRGRERKTRKLRRSFSAPTLAHRLSHKISEIFQQETIIHRVKERSRPSAMDIANMSESFGGNLRLEAFGKADMFDHSHDTTIIARPQINGLSSSLRGQERHKITFPKSMRPHVITNQKPVSSLLGHLRRGKAGLIYGLKGVPEALPSIQTVEATSMAKIFFESHFEEIIYEADLRRKRLLDVELTIEECISSGSMTEEDAETIRIDMHNQENYNLRRNRVLKARSNRNGTTGVEIAGFEVVRILGKGSFGVVRLVREKSKSSGVMTRTPRAFTQLEAATAQIANALNPMELIRALNARISSKQHEESQSGRVYAMKVIRKSDMLRHGQESHIRAERDFLVAAAGSQWIISLVTSFQDSRNLYLVMDYMPGGDFLSLLIRKNIISEDYTRQYLAEMVLCVEATHKLGWIHRDIKPDNFLLAADGHLKISDFGLAFDDHWAHSQDYYDEQRQSLMAKFGLEVKGDEADAKYANKYGQAYYECFKKEFPEQLRGEDLLSYRQRVGQRKLARSILGTSQYMAPEVIQGDYYDGRSDWWSIGIILFEVRIFLWRIEFLFANSRKCLYGFTPFSCENPHDTKKKILHHKKTLEIPRNLYYQQKVSCDAINLILNLVCDKERRLSSKRYKANDLANRNSAERNKRSQQSKKIPPNFAGRHVYPDDAEEIKNHPFFRGLKWDELHMMKAPYVPTLPTKDCTKYFDMEDHHISDGESFDTSDSCSASDCSSHCGTPRTRLTRYYQNLFSAAGGFENWVRFSAMENGISAEHFMALEDKKIAVMYHGFRDRYELRKKRKERRKNLPRARDLILRDPATKKAALMMRKKGAFWGYEYRKFETVGDIDVQPVREADGSDDISVDTDDAKMETSCTLHLEAKTEPLPPVMESIHTAL